MRLSLAELKQKNESVLLEEALETIQGGTASSCHRQTREEYTNPRPEVILSRPEVD